MNLHYNITGGDKILKALKNYQLEENLKFLSKNDIELLQNEPLLADTTIRYDDWVLSNKVFVKSESSAILDISKENSISSHKGDYIKASVHSFHVSSYVFDPVFEHAHQILLCGRTNYSPIIVGFTYLQDISVMAHNLFQRIHSVRIFHEKSPFLLVGTYQKVNKLFFFVSISICYCFISFESERYVSDFHWH